MAELTSGIKGADMSGVADPAEAGRILGMTAAANGTELVAAIHDEQGHGLAVVRDASGQTHVVEGPSPAINALVVALTE